MNNSPYANDRLYAGDFIYKTDILFQEDSVVLVTKINQEDKDGKYITSVSLTTFKERDTFVYNENIIKYKIKDPEKIQELKLRYKMYLLQES